MEELLAGDTDPIATVNGRAIPAAKLRAYQALTSPDGPLEIERPPLTAEGYVDMLVENELLYQEAERRGLIPSDEEVLAAARQYKAQLLDALQADTPEVARIQEYFRQIEGTPYHYEQYDKSPVMLDAFRRMIAIGRLRQSIIEAMPPGERGDFDKREAAVNELVAALRADADIQINLR